jgi:hypothetical protein
LERLPFRRPRVVIGGRMNATESDVKGKGEREFSVFNYRLSNFGG